MPLMERNGLVRRLPATPIFALCGETTLTPIIVLRKVREDDLSVFFTQQLDTTANHMAAFTVPNPQDREAFTTRWTRILGEPSNHVRTIVWEGQVAGYVSSYPQEGHTEVTYWLGREHWGQGIATTALALFLEEIKIRPLYARAAQDNRASLRVLAKCGFKIYGEDAGFSAARSQEVEEFLLTLPVKTTEDTA